MKVLGVVGSARKMGNSELLVKEAINSVQDKGGTVELIRLTDLNIKQCVGCMYCAFTKSPCKLNDDFGYLIEKLSSAQGLILGAPTYILMPPAIIKSIIDRYLAIAPHIEQWNNTHRMGVTINVAGLREWSPFNSSLLNMFLFAFQYRLIGSMCAYGPGPGETLTIDENINQAAALGSKLIYSLQQPKNVSILSDSNVSNTCPACLNTAFKVKDNGHIECPICGLEGTLYMNKDTSKYEMEFSPTLEGYRWSKDAQISHYENWIFASKDKFKEKYPHIKQLIKKYKDLDNLWDRP